MSRILLFLLVFAIPTSQLHAGMITTDRVVASMAKERQAIATFLQREEVRDRVVELGVSPEEAETRLASLSDQEVAQIAGKLDQLPAGGEGIYIGFGALLLIIIILILLFK